MLRFDSYCEEFYEAFIFFIFKLFLNNIIKFIEGFSVNSDFRTSSLKMNIALTGNYDVNILSPQTISAVIPYTVVSVSSTLYPAQTVSLDHYSITKSDVYYINKNQKFLTLIENIYSEISLDVS